MLHQTALSKRVSQYNGLISQTRQPQWNVDASHNIQENYISAADLFNLAHLPSPNYLSQLFLINHF